MGRGVGVAEFREETRQVLARVREALPESGCLLTGIIEHEMSGRSRIRPHHVQAIVDAQRAAAHEAGCAFFDTYAAMGNRQQRIMVIPSEELVIVRLGWTAGGYPTGERFARIVDAL